MAEYTTAATICRDVANEIEERLRLDPESALVPREITVAEDICTYFLGPGEQTEMLACIADLPDDPYGFVRYMRTLATVCDRAGLGLQIEISAVPGRTTAVAW